MSAVCIIRSSFDGVSTVPRVIDFESFASERGLSRHNLGEHAIHKRRSSHSDAQWSKIVEAQLFRDRELSGARAALRDEYRRLVNAGKIRPPTIKEQCEDAATGHPDNPATQAAIECLRIMQGIDRE